MDSRWGTVERILPVSSIRRPKSSRLAGGRRTDRAWSRGTRVANGAGRWRRCVGWPRSSQRGSRSCLHVVGIRGLLRFSDDDLRTALPAAKIHVVQSGRQADETVLDAATKATAWVVSNDRFGDYRDKRCVKEGRIIRHEILSDRILVHDLGVDEPIDVR